MEDFTVFGTNITILFDDMEVSFRGNEMQR